MLCNNCGKREANVKYTETINGKTRKLNLCEECSKELGIDQIDFRMPFDFTGFFDDFMEEFRMPELIPIIGDFDETRIMPTRKIARRNAENIRNKEKIGKTIDEKINNRNAKKDNGEKTPKEILQEKLEKAIKEERYEDAAKIRDEIAKIN